MFHIPKHSMLIGSQLVAVMKINYIRDCVIPFELNVVYL